MSFASPSPTSTSPQPSFSRARLLLVSLVSLVSLVVLATALGATDPRAKTTGPTTMPLFEDGFEQATPCAWSNFGDVVAPFLRATDLAVTLGATLEARLDAFDCQGDPITFSAAPLPLPDGAALDSVTGDFSFRPEASQVGSFDLTFTADDGAASTSQTVTVTVDPGPGGPTTLTGTVLDANAYSTGQVVPIVGVTVTLLGSGITATTNSAGIFTLSGAPSGAQVLDLDAATSLPAPNGDPYASFREAYFVIPDVVNEITRPLYLPRMDMSSATTVDPMQETVVHNPNLNMTLFVPPHSAKNPDGSDFTGELTISLVPPGLAPAELPSELQPGLLVTIQPVGVIFDPPAPLTFADVDSMMPGNETSLWSLDPNEGVFTVVGRGEVQNDGTIDTVSGGVRAADWHAMLPPSPDDRPNPEDDPPCRDCCRPCRAASGSEVDLKTGALLETIDLPTYASQGQERGLRLHYDSRRANPTTLLPLDVVVAARAAVPERLSYQLTVGGVGQGPPVHVDTSSLSESVDESLRVVTAFDASSQPTGTLPVSIVTTSHYPASAISRTLSREITVINESASPMGSGWTLGGLSRIVTTDSQALLVEGDGRSLEFQRGGDDVVILHNNFFSAELTQLRLYLEEMGLDAEVRSTHSTTAEQLAETDLVIFDDSCCATSFFEITVDLIEELADDGKSLYFIGDDLAFQADCCLAEPQAKTWETLTHLERSANSGGFGGAGRIELVQPQHPVLNGPFGSVVPFDYTSDSDRTTNTGTGESILATVNDAPTLLAYEAPSGSRTVTQNTLAYNGIFVAASRAEAKRMFQNAVDWLLRAPANDDGSHRSPAGDRSTLFRNPDTTYVRTLTNGTQYVYDAAGRLTSVTDRNGNATTYTYDPSGRLETITDPVGLETTFVYVGGLLASITDPASRTTLFEHDTVGHLLSVTLPDGAEREFTYDEHRMVTQTDERDFTTSYEYDAVGRLARSFWPDGSQRAASNAQSVGLVDLSSGFGTESNPAPVTRPADAAASFTDGEERSITMKGDTFGQPMELTDRAGLTTLSDTSSMGRTERLELPSGHILRATYDTLGNQLTATDDQVSGTFTYTYDPDFNQVETVTDPFSNTTTFGFDGTGNIVSTTSPESRTTSATYFAGGLVETSTDELGTTTTFTYDADGMVQQIDAGTGVDQRTTTITRTAAGYLDTVTDAESRVTSFTYDSMGRQLTTTLPDSEVVATTWDAQGNLATLTPPSTPAHAFTYTESGQLASYQPPALSGDVDTTYTYDDSGRLTEVDRPDGRSVIATYDAAGRLATRQIARGTTTFTYDPTSGLLASLTAPNNEVLSFSYTGELPSSEAWSGSVAGSVSRTFDAAGGLATESVNGANPVSFTYDDDGLLTGAGSLAITRDSNTGLVSGTTLGMVTDSWTWNDFGELTGYSVAHDTTTLYSLTLTNDKLGRVTSKTETIGGVSTTYDTTYDLRGQIDRVDIDSSLAASYTYDDNGNRLTRSDGIVTETGTYDDQDRATSYDGVSLTYRQSGELLTRTDGTQVSTYDYDEAGNLVSVTLPDKAVVSYVIDGLDRRVGKRIDGTLVQGLLYRDQLSPIAELDSSGNVVSRFVYATRLHVPDYLVRGGSTYRIVADSIGSVRLVIDVATGVVAQRLDYDEFGRVLLDTNPGFQPFGFAGGLYDPDTELVRFGARDYDPHSGRWTAKDPIRFQGGETNLYRYAAGDPVNGIDPTGKDRLEVHIQWAERQARNAADAARRVRDNTDRLLLEVEVFVDHEIRDIDRDFWRMRRDGERRSRMFCNDEEGYIESYQRFTDPEEGGLFRTGRRLLRRGTSVSNPLFNPNPVASQAARQLGGIGGRH